MGEMGLSIDNIMSKEDVDSLFTEDGQESEEPVDETGDEGKVVETNNNGDNRKTDEIAVHCETKEEAKDFCRQMNNHELKWKDGQSYLGDYIWDKIMEDTCYDNHGGYQNILTAKEHNSVLE